MTLRVTEYVDLRGTFRSLGDRRAAGHLAGQERLRAGLSDEAGS